MVDPARNKPSKTSSYKNTVIIRGALDARGIDADALLREAGIDPLVYAGSDKRVPFESVDKLFALVVERTGDPSIGIGLVEHKNPTVYEALGVALLCSSTLRNFFRRFERFFDLVSSLEKATFYETDYGGYLAEEPQVEYSEQTRGVHADAFCAVALKFMRIVYQPDYAPYRLDLNWTPPAEQHTMYAEHFGCEIRFGADVTALHVAAKDLDVPLTGSNASLAFHNDQLAVAILADLKKQDLQARVYARLIEYLPAGDCNREKVAHSLNMSESRLTGRINVVHTGGKCGLDNGLTESFEGPDDVADDLGAVKQLGQVFDRIFDGDNFVVSGLDARHMVHDILDSLGVTACRNERNTVLTQELADKTTGVAACAVDNDRFFVVFRHGSTSDKLEVDSRKRGLFKRVNRGASPIYSGMVRETLFFILVTAYGDCFSL